MKTLQTTLTTADGRTLPVEIDTEFLFSYQWNGRVIVPAGEIYHETAAIRLFDKSDVRMRHYSPSWLGSYTLTVTDEMRALREATLQCGYCGALYGPHHDKAHKRGPLAGFCRKCLGSEYLKLSDLHLLRLHPLMATRPMGAKAPLTAQEAARIEPIYWRAQAKGRTARERKARAQARRRVVENYRATIDNAKVRHTTRLFMLRKGYPLRIIGEHIYYPHTKRHCFGWNKPLNADDAGYLRMLLAAHGFPGEYDINESREASRPY